MLLLFSILTCICITQAKVKVTSMGIATISRGDTGLIFYLTLHNLGETLYTIHLRMVKCCEVLEESDLECRIMKLLGGDMGLIYPQQIRNVSLLYPNMYIHNRRGKCLVCIKYLSKTNCTIETKEAIKFDTYIEGPKTNSVVLRDYYKKTEFTKCETVDQDPLDNCEPVNCEMKYLGCRNYFNTKWQRCQKVPVCVSDPKKDLPDVAYIPLSNMCMDLENVVKPKDLRYFEENTGDEGEYEKPNPIFVSSASLRCHHGHYNNRTGFCVCDQGWMSAVHDKDTYALSLGVYHMCNIQISTWNEANRTRIKMTMIIITILGAIIAVSAVMLAIFCNLLYMCLRPNLNKSSSKSPFRFQSEGSTQLGSTNSRGSYFSKVFNAYNTSTNKSSGTDGETINDRSINLNEMMDEGESSEYCINAEECETALSTVPSNS